MKDLHIFIALALIIAIVLIQKTSEKYTNLVLNDQWNKERNQPRVVANFFDNCSPENLEDCKRNNNPYEGLPLP